MRFRYFTWQGPISMFNARQWGDRDGLKIVGLCSIEFVHSPAVFENLIPFMRINHGGEDAHSSSIMIPLHDAWNCPLLVEPQSRDALEVADIDDGIRMRAGSFIDYEHYGSGLSLELVERDDSTATRQARRLKDRIATGNYDSLEIAVTFIAACRKAPTAEWSEHEWARASTSECKYEWGECE
jgi:hypothetical protein